MSWQAVLYLAIAALGPRLLFRVIGRWLRPLAPPSPTVAPPTLPARPPLGDYRRPPDG